VTGIVGGVEGGGTHFFCVLARVPHEELESKEIQTTDPTTTLRLVGDFFEEACARAGVPLEALGVASFGPIDLTRTSPDYGYITSTPKHGWEHTNVVGALHDRLGVAVGWDTDVNGAALGEQRFGALRGADPAVYITVGTGIGGGAMVHGAPIHGMLHPEMGHILVRRQDGDLFPGDCQFHRDCLEGMASGRALIARARSLGRQVLSAGELAVDDPLWDLEARYLALGLKTITDVLSPQRIVVGGGVMEHPGLLAIVRRHVVDLHHGYLRHSSILDNIDDYIVGPSLKRPGLYGALELARMELQGK
jgi:fructokinase